MIFTPYIVLISKIRPLEKSRTSLQPYSRLVYLGFSMDHTEDEIISLLANPLLVPGLNPLLVISISGVLYDRGPICFLLHSGGFMRMASALDFESNGPVRALA